MVGQSPRLDDLRMLLAVADHGGFSRAAVHLGRPKQTISRRVLALERDLGVRLLNRTTRSVRLTPAGLALVDPVREALQLVAEGVQAVRSQAAEPQGILRITATHVLGEAVLAPALHGFLADHPGVQADVLLTNRRVDLVAEGFDLGLRAGPLRDSSLVATRLGPARIRYVASPAYLAAEGAPVHPAALAHTPCLVHPLEPGPARWPLLVEGKVRSLPVQERLRANNAAMVRAAALAGLGIALLPEPVCTDDLAEGRLVVVLAEHTPSGGEVHALTPSRRLRAPRVRGLLARLVALPRPTLLAP